MSEKTEITREIILARAEQYKLQGEGKKITVTCNEERAAYWRSINHPNIVINTSGKNYVEPVLTPEIIAEWEKENESVKVLEGQLGKTTVRED